MEGLWPDDLESTWLLQEWLGYLLLPDTSQQKIALLVGPKRSGKSTIARVLAQLIGPPNVCSPTLSSLALNFGLQPLLGKTVAVIADARLSGRMDTAVVVERLLSISGEDNQTIDRKHMSQVTGKLPVRFTIISNELPRLNDASGALVGRLLILRFTKSWYGNEDTRLTQRLLAELPGILLWSLRGWARLRDRGHFIQPAASARLVQQMQDLASPVGAFVRECCVLQPGACMPMADLYDRYAAWCVAQGRRQPDRLAFGRDLRAAVPCLGESRPRVGAQRIRMCEGIRIRREDEEDAGSPF